MWGRPSQSWRSLCRKSTSSEVSTSDDSVSPLASSQLCTHGSSCHFSVFVQWIPQKVPALLAPKRRWSTSSSSSMWTISTSTLWERTTSTWCSWWQRNPRRYGVAVEEGTPRLLYSANKNGNPKWTFQGYVLSSLTCRVMQKNNRVGAKLKYGI